jgi:hypothetical protein
MSGGVSQNLIKSLRVSPAVISATVEDYLVANPPQGYTHPSTHPAAMIAEDSNNRFVTDTEKNTWNNKLDGNHSHIEFAPVLHNHDSSYSAVNHNHNADYAAISHGHFTILTLGGDITTGANTNPVNLTGLTFDFLANSTYIIDMYMFVSAAASTTGCGFQIDTSVAVNQIGITFFHQLANTGTLSGGNSIADDASQGVSSGIPANAGVYPVYGGGILKSGANAGTAQFRFRSETTAATTCKAGSIIRIFKV